jgi:hypothetical protein
MKQMIHIKKLIVSLFLQSIVLIAYALEIPDYNMATYDQEIQAMYKNPELETDTINKRIEIISAYFLGRPYLNGALGEGASASFDQEPLYRTDAFDCLTYVSTVLALAESKNIHDFQKNMLKIQYKNAQPTFVNRLHFTSVDWNVENAKNHFIQDMTETFKNSQGKPMTEVAIAIINKPRWYKNMSADNLRLIHSLSAQQEKKRLAELRNLSSQVSIEKSRLSYLPLTALFNKAGEPEMTVFDQIPTGAIMEIVRPNWNLEKIIGTHLNVSHLGFVIRTSQGLMFREASSIERHVVDEPLIAYLKNYLNSSTVKGITIQTAESEHLIEISSKSD